MSYFSFSNSHPIVSFLFNYRPQRSCEGYLFTPFCLSTGGGGSASVYAGIPPPPEQTPQTSPPETRHPPWEGAPPPEQAPLVANSPLWNSPPPGAAPPPPADGYCCGRYASYWNAFLFKVNLHLGNVVLFLKNTTISLFSGH